MSKLSWTCFELGTHLSKCRLSHSDWSIHSQNVAAGTCCIVPVRQGTPVCSWAEGIGFSKSSHAGTWIQLGSRPEILHTRHANDQPAGPDIRVCSRKSLDVLILRAGRHSCRACLHMQEPGLTSMPSVQRERGLSQKSKRCAKQHACSMHAHGMQILSGSVRLFGDTERMAVPAKPQVG